MPVGSIPNHGFNVYPLIQVYPPNSGRIATNIPLIWGTLNNNHYAGDPLHFHVQITLSSDPLFASPVVEGKSWVDSTIFDYESSPGTWTQLPASGLAESDIGKNVRFREPVIAAGIYIWRVRVLEFV